MAGAARSRRCDGHGARQFTWGHAARLASATRARLRLVAYCFRHWTWLVLHAVHWGFLPAAVLLRLVLVQTHVRPRQAHARWCCAHDPHDPPGPMLMPSAACACVPACRLVFCVTFWIYVLLILFFLLARKRDPGSPKDPRVRVLYDQLAAQQRRTQHSIRPSASAPSDSLAHLAGRSCACRFEARSPSTGR